MKFRLNQLTLSLLRGEVTIDFGEVSYFWGQMGSGKTSIARLVDYCLGGNIQLSPALQAEFVSATLNMSLDQDDLTIERPRDSDYVIASWGQGDEAYHLNLPARKSEGEVWPGTGVEVLSDLLFRLSGLVPPRVRKSKIKEDSDLARLSMRDLLWYCYLDQDEIDSSFFHLEEEAPFYLRAKSRDVLRYIIGFHSEKVAELEAERAPSNQGPDRTRTERGLGAVRHGISLENAYDGTGTCLSHTRSGKPLGHASPTQDG